MLGCAVEQLPSPIAAAADRLASLLGQLPSESNASVARSSRSIVLIWFLRLRATTAPPPPSLDGALVCNADAPLLVYVSKVFAVDRAALPRGDSVLERSAYVRGKSDDGSGSDGARVIGADDGDGDENHSGLFIAFARVLSGTLRRGMRVRVSVPHSVVAVDGDDDGDVEPTNDEEATVVEVDVGDLYLLMGRQLEALDEAPAGAVIGIGG